MRLSISVSLFFIMFLTGCSNKANSTLSVNQIKCTGYVNPVGTVKIPDFSWILKSDERGQIQTAYQIIIGSDSAIVKKGKGDIWDSGKIASDESAWIPYKGSPLQPAKEYFWRVRVWDGKDNPTSWSTTGKFVSGLFDRKD